MKIYNKKINLAVFLAMVTFFNQTQAADHVYSPYVEQGELEVEWKNNYDFDHNKDKSGASSQKFALGYGVNNFWATEIYAIVEKDGETGSSYNLNGVEFENIFQLTERGQYWADFGLYTAYTHSLKSGTPNEAELKLLVAKDTGMLTHYANIQLARENGDEASNSTEVGFKWSTRYRLDEKFMPGFEIHSNFGSLNHFNYDDQKHQVGPMFYGRLFNNFRYEIGYLIGTSKEAPDGQLKSLIEYEIHF